MAMTLTCNGAYVNNTLFDFRPLHGFRPPCFNATLTRDKWAPWLNHTTNAAFSVLGSAMAPSRFLPTPVLLQGIHDPAVRKSEVICGKHDWTREETHVVDQADSRSPLWRIPTKSFLSSGSVKKEETRPGQISGWVRKT